MSNVTCTSLRGKTTILNLFGNFQNLNKNFEMVPLLFFDDVCFFCIAGKYVLFYCTNIICAQIRVEKSSRKLIFYIA